MAFRILLNESSASRRCVPIWIVGSDGTTPITNASDKTFTFEIGGVFYGSGGSLSATSSVDGMYTCNFRASKVSVMGPGQVMYRDSGSLPASTPFEIVPLDSYDSMRMGLFALPNVVHSAAGGLPTEGTGTGQISLSGGSVGLKAQTHSQATVGGADNLGRRLYSDLTVRIEGVDYSGLTIKGISNYANISSVTLNVGTHSGATVQGVNRINSGVTLNADTHSGATIQGLSNYANISNVTLAAGTHSNVTIQGVTRINSGVTLNADTHSGATIQGVTRLNSNVTLNANTHSGATIQGISNWANISSVTLNIGVHSGATIQGVQKLDSSVTLNANTHSGATIAGIVDGGIIASTLASGVLTSAKFAVGAVDAAALATDAGQEIADRVLNRNLASGSDGGRDVRSALYPLRNRSEIEGSTGTVYTVDDSTSAWTFTVTSLGTLPIAGIDPLGP